MVIFTPALMFVVNQYTDYGAHLGFIRGLLEQGDWQVFVSRVPHLLFHALVLGVYGLLPNLGAAGFVVSLLLYIGLALAIYSVLILLLGRPPTNDGRLFYGVITLGMMVVMPVNLLTPDHLYHGYIATNVYHNPTIVVLKPFAVLLFGFSVAAFDTRATRLNPFRVLLYMGLTTLSILAKPSYILILLPALVILIPYYLLLRRRVDWRLVILGILLPAGVILVAQAVFFDTSMIVYAPLAFFYAQGTTSGLALKLLLSILFPLAVTLLYFKTASRSALLMLAWVSFLFGVALTYLFAEANRAGHGNLTWSGQIGAFILFLATMVFWLKQNHLLSFSNLRTVKVTPAFVTTAVLLVLHLISGLLWYFTHASGIWPRW